MTPRTRSVNRTSRALAAKAHGVPFVIAAPLSTIDRATPDGAAIPIEERGADESRTSRAWTSTACCAACATPEGRARAIPDRRDTCGARHEPADRARCGDRARRRTRHREPVRARLNATRTARDTPRVRAYKLRRARRPARERRPRRRDFAGASAVHQRRWSNPLVGVDALRIHPAAHAASVLGILIGSGALVATMAVSDGPHGVRARARATRTVRAGRHAESAAVALRGRRVGAAARSTRSSRARTQEALLRHAPGVQSATLVLGGRAEVSLRGERRHASITFGTVSLPEFGPDGHGRGPVLGSRARRNLPVVDGELGARARACSTAIRRRSSGARSRRAPRATLVRRARGDRAFENREGPFARDVRAIALKRGICAATKGGASLPTLRLLARSLESVDGVADARPIGCRRWADWQRRVSRRSARAARTGRAGVPAASCSSARSGSSLPGGIGS